MGIKPTALSDDELKEVSDGMIVSAPRSQKCEDALLYSSALPRCSYQPGRR